MCLVCLYTIRRMKIGSLLLAIWFFINPFHATGLFRYLYRKTPVAWNGLSECKTSPDKFLNRTKISRETSKFFWSCPALSSKCEDLKACSGNPANLFHWTWNNRKITLKDPFISESCIEIKIKLNFYFHTSLWCLKRFYEGLYKTF